MNILINRKPVEGPWGGGNHFVKAIFDIGKYRGHKIVTKFNHKIDAIIIQDPRYDELGISLNEITGFKYLKPKTIVLHRVNECDARKSTDNMDQILRDCSKISDITVFVSEWMQMYHEHYGWHCENKNIIRNGVDTKIFKPIERTPEKKLKVVTHHWSNNEMKGFDVYNFLDDLAGRNDDIEFIYIGREQGKFKNTTIIPPCFGEELATKLADNDVYVSGTKWDPGPNHIIESLACGLPTYVHSKGGGAVEFSGIDHSFQTLEELENILLKRNFTPNQWKPESWEKSINAYFNLLEKAKLDS